EHVALDEATANRLGGVDDQRMGLAKRQQTECVIEVAVGEEDGGDRRMARTAWVEPRERLDLLPDLRRAVQQRPGGAVGAHRHALLAAGPHSECPLARPPTVPAATVPLREATAGR